MSCVMLHRLVFFVMTLIVSANSEKRNCEVFDTNLSSKIFCHSNIRSSSSIIHFLFKKHYLKFHFLSTASSKCEVCTEEPRRTNCRHKKYKIIVTKRHYLRTEWYIARYVNKRPKPSHVILFHIITAAIEGSERIMAAERKKQQ